MATSLPIRLIAVLVAFAIADISARASHGRGTRSESGARAAASTTARVEGLCQLFPEVTACMSEAGPTFEDAAGTDRVLVERVIRDGADGRLDEHSLLEAALIVGGTRNDATRRRYEARLAAALAALTEDIKRTDDAIARAKMVHDYLHTQLFVGGYQQDASDLRCVFEAGQFNCVSGTLLYCYLCKRLGIECQIVQWHDHVACRLLTNGAIVNGMMTDGEAVAIETTCREWFEARGLTRSGASTIPKNLSASGRASFANHQDEGRILSEAQLLALIYYNRGVQCLHAKHYSAAMRASFRALWLDPDNAAAWNNFLAAVNNQALAHSRQGDYHAAVELLNRGQRAAPNYATFKVNFLHVQQRRLQAERQRG